MYRGPRDPRYSEVPTEPSWQSLAVSYAMLATTMLLLWAAADLLLSAALLVAVLGIALGTRRLLALARCLSECGGFTLDVGGKLQICVSQPSVAEPC